MTQQNPVPPSQPAPSPAPDTPPHREASDHEEVYFEGSPLIRGNLGKFLVYLAIGLVIAASPFLIRHFAKDATIPWFVTTGLIVIGLIVILVPIIVIKALRFRITNYRIDIERGILGKRIDTMELWHVEDIQFNQSLFDRIVGCGTITIISHDDTTPKLVMPGLPNPRPLYESIKQRVIAVKRQRGVVKMDIGGHGDISAS